MSRFRMVVVQVRSQMVSNDNFPCHSSVQNDFIDSIGQSRHFGCEPVSSGYRRGATIKRAGDWVMPFAAVHGSGLAIP
jgi:hypothetical protein